MPNQSDTIAVPEVCADGNDDSYKQSGERQTNLPRIEAMICVKADFERAEGQAQNAKQHGREDTEVRAYGF